MKHINEVIDSSFDLRDYGIVADANLPEEFQLPVLPSVKNQGSKPTCVAHACASLVEYNYLNRYNKYRAFSTQFIYGLRDVGYYVGEGMMSRNALKTLHTFGVPFKTTCPGNDGIEKALADVNANIDTYILESLDHVIDSYFRCRSEAEIKTALVTYGPVLISMNYNSLATISDDKYINSDDFDGGGHCMFIYGWNKDGWLVQNSWGNKWAGDGRFTLPYAEKLKEAWGVAYPDADMSKIRKPGAFKMFIYKLYNKVANWYLTKFA